MILNERHFASSPSFFSVIPNDSFRPTDRVGVKFNELYKKPKQNSHEIFVTKSGTKNLNSEFKTAGPVRIDDVDFTLFSINDYAFLNNNFNAIGDGALVWVAKDQHNDWNVYRVCRNNLRLISVTNLGDNLVMFEFNQSHGVNVDEIFIVKNLNNSLNGAYKVSFVPNSNSVVVEYPGSTPNFEKIINLNGYILKLVSIKFEYPNRITERVSGQHWIAAVS